MLRLRHSLLLLVFAAGTALAQTDAPYVEDLLKEEVLPPSVAMFQLRQYILNRVGKLPTPGSAAEWTTQSKHVRDQIVNDVVFHGWPKEWIDAAPKFEEVSVVTGNGYRMRKFRYEIVPGFQSVAILYEPLNMQGKVPAILNVNGHVGAPGKAVEYKQKRCITFARHGILALNLEWLSCGELDTEFNQHWYGAHVDLVGSNELGLFYLAMRRGLDYLYEHPQTDRSRVGMTGLSGGGWQTIILTSLDERVKVAVPVAGFSSIVPRVEAKEHGDIGDVEQSATDLFDGRDYPWLAALRAPRPTLLAYNAEDDCCFRAAMVKPGVFDAILPFFALYGKQDDFAWHENRDPGTHNYQLDNRMAAYDFFSRQFKLPPIKEDPAIGSEIKSYEDLVVGLPKDNLTVVGLARKFADQVNRDALSSDASARDMERAKLRNIVRYRTAKIDRVWTTGISKHLGVESKSHLFGLADGLSSNAIWLKPIGAPDTAPATIVLDDKGKGNTAALVANRLNRGEQVLALDLPFQGDAWHQDGTWLFEQMINTVGDRPLGIEAAHLIELANWLKRRGATSVRLESSGMRNQVVCLVAAAIEPSLFSELVIRQGIPSLRYLVDKPVKYQDAADLFCLDLYKFTDLDRLAALGAPTAVKTQASD
jgi:dienelactone hydrolase